MEEYYILSNVIKQALDRGFMSSVIKDAENQTIEMFEDKWRLSSGFEIGSTWDIILNVEFAKVMWGEDYRNKLTELVVLSHSERIQYLKKSVDEEEGDNLQNKEEIKPIDLTEVDALMATIMRAKEYLREKSEGLFKDTCKLCYDRVSPVIKKESVTALNEDDYIKLNAGNKATNGAVFEYLRQNGKASFGKCPDCGQEGLNHDQGCSIEKKTINWLIGQNQGC